MSLSPHLDICKFDSTHKSRNQDRSFHQQSILSLHQIQPLCNKNTLCNYLGVGSFYCVDSLQQIAQRQSFYNLEHLNKSFQLKDKSSLLIFNYKN